MLSIEDIERVMDETQEGIEKQREIDELLTGTLTQEDEDAVLEELNQILAEKEPEVVKEEEVEEADINLPDVPTHEPKGIYYLASKLFLLNPNLNFIHSASEKSQERNYCSQLNCT